VSSSFHPHQGPLLSPTAADRLEVRILTPPWSLGVCEFEICLRKILGKKRGTRTCPLFEFFTVLFVLRVLESSELFCSFRFPNILSLFLLMVCTKASRLRLVISNMGLTYYILYSALEYPPSYYSLSLYKFIFIYLLVVERCLLNAQLVKLPYTRMTPRSVSMVLSTTNLVQSAQIVNARLV
jgi:hypothetical protein